MIHLFFSGLPVLFNNRHMTVRWGHPTRFLRSPSVPQSFPVVQSRAPSALAVTRAAPPMQRVGVNQRPPGSWAERPLGRTAGVLRFRSSSDSISVFTLTRFKFFEASH